MLRIEIGGLLSQQVFGPRLIAKYSANPLLFWGDSAVGLNYPILQQLGVMFKPLIKGMSTRAGRAAAADN